MDSKEQSCSFSGLQLVVQVGGVVQLGELQCQLAGTAGVVGHDVQPLVPSPAPHAGHVGWHLLDCSGAVRCRDELVLELVNDFFGLQWQQGGMSRLLVHGYRLLVHGCRLQAM